MSRIEIKKETLEKLYFEDMMSMREISKELGVGYNTVVRRFDKYDIPRRTFTEGAQLSFKQKRKRGELKVTILSCPECSKEFEIKNSLIRRAENNFCSKSCSGSFIMKEYWKENNTRVDRMCGNCERPLKVPLHKTLKFKNSFCDKKCHNEFSKKTTSNKGENHWKYSSIETLCYVCKEKHIRTPSKMFERNYCSKECMAIDYQDRMIGLNNPNFVHGGNIYYGPNWKEISLSIRERDNFTCQRCLLQTNEKGQLDVHHIVRLFLFNENYDEANKESNLVTLCKSCHNIVEYNGIDFKLPTECIVQPTTNDEFG